MLGAGVLRWYKGYVLLKFHFKNIFLICNEETAAH